MECSLEENCLKVVHKCDVSNDTCIIVVPPIQLIVIKDGFEMTKYFNPNLSVHNVLSVRLFPQKKKLVMVHRIDPETTTAAILVFRFGQNVKTQLLSQNYVKLSKHSHFKSFFEKVSGDRTCLDISFVIFDVIMFYRMHHLHTCFVYSDQKMSCFTLLEPHVFASPLSPSFSFNNSKANYFLIKVFVFMILVNVLIFGLLFLWHKKVDYKDYLVHPSVKNNPRFIFQSQPLNNKFVQF
jgi:hypothetical protein